MTAQGFDRLLHRLVEAEVDFILVGGLAVNAWGYLRGTQDIDIVPDPTSANLERLEQILGELDGRVLVGDRALKPSAIKTFLRAGDKTLVRTSLGEVDVLQGLPQIPRYDELAPRATDVELEGIKVKVCSLEDLRAMKRAADRPLDRLDLEALEIAHPEDPEGR